MPGLSMGRVFGAAVVILVSGAARADDVYLALGDSVAFGFTRLIDLTPTYADQGYVAPYADWLGHRAGGVRPRVINLAIPQESTRTYFTGGLPGTAANLNYTSPTTSQSAMLAQTIASEHAAGNTIGNVSLALGTNDLLALGNDPEFLAADLPTQAARVLEVLQVVADGLAQILAVVAAQAPEAEIVMPGYYNPYAAVPGHPLFDIAPIGVQALNAVLEISAEQAGARYVDVYTAFDGREGELTWMLLDGPIGSNIHPTPEGYAVIAGAMIPEPGCLALAVVAAGAGRRRRR